MAAISAEEKGTSQKSAQILEVVEKGDVTNVVRRGTLQESVQTQRTLVMLLVEEVAVVTSVMNPVILPANVQMPKMVAVETEAVDATSVANLATWHGTAPIQIQVDEGVTVNHLSMSINVMLANVIAFGF